MEKANNHILIFLILSVLILPAGFLIIFYNQTFGQESGKCGDGTCDSIEKQMGVCPKDCGSGSSTSTSGTSGTSGQQQSQSSGGKCGDGTCDTMEKANPSLCPKDCGSGSSTSTSGTSGQQQSQPSSSSPAPSETPEQSDQPAGQEEFKSEQPAEGQTPETELFVVFEYQLPEVSVLADSWFYFLKRTGESINSFFTFGKQNNAERRLYLAEKRLAEFKKLTQNEAEDEYLQKAIDDYYGNITKTVYYKNKMKEISVTFEKKFSQGLMNHQHAFLEDYKTTSSVIKKSIVKIIGKIKAEAKKSAELLSAKEQEKINKEQRFLDEELRKNKGRLN